MFFSSWEDDVVAAHLEVEQAADADRRRRPHHQSQGGQPARPRAAHRRGTPARRARQHVALQPADRPAARDPGGAPRHAAAHLDRPRRAAEPVAGSLRSAGGGHRRGEAREDLPVDHAVPPGPRLGRPPGVPGRHPGEHPPAGAGPSEPARRVPPDGRRRVRLIGRRRDRGGAADLRYGRRPSRTSRASTCPSWRGRPRRGRTWCTTTRSPKTRCRR